MHNRKNQFPNKITKCPKCENPFFIESWPKYNGGCKSCGRQKIKLLKCMNNTCGLNIGFCEICDEVTIGSPIQGLLKNTLNHNSNNILHEFICSKYFLLLVSLILGLGIYKYCNVTEEIGVSRSFKILKQKYPSQKNETWPHFLSVLEKEIPSVKTITLMYNKDKNTTNCLTNELVFLYSGNRTFAQDKITFSSVGFEGLDYGVALEYYVEVVKKYRILITDLNNVSGNLARIFHSLCDEVSSKMKPSLFIFSLKYQNENEMLKPVERANNILKENWKDLPETDLFPLLPRIVKNVVDIVPEMNSPC